MTARLSIAVLIVGCVAGCSEPGVAPPAIPGNVDEAQVAARIADADREVREALDSADAWGRLGVVYDVHRFFDRALECYGTATTLDPDEWRWPYFSGIVLRTSDQAAALEQFERAAELNPDHAPLQLYLGFGHFLEESVDEAGKHYARALELDPRSVNARIGLAQVALAGRDAGRAVQLLEEARDI
ncbi:MAG: tetratricopeptide repeat protein, partial [Acidobacteria bacterium]|nr:tetratricopeptide repeat protein [Acidobacteriota bacterium]NIQ84948.1 tetratricopeptide repeat protein [Acidobacteriota bacterium]